MRLKIVGIIFTLLGVALFGYFIYSVGVGEIFAGIGKIGFGGFAVITILYFLRFARAGRGNCRFRPYRPICATPFRRRLAKREVDIPRDSRQRHYESRRRPPPRSARRRIVLDCDGKSFLQFRYFPVYRSRRVFVSPNIRIDGRLGNHD